MLGSGDSEDEPRILRSSHGIVQSIGWESSQKLLNICFVRSNHAFGVNTSKAPFNDIRVRKAMQMALELETIKNTCLRGMETPRPGGCMGLNSPGIMSPLKSGPKMSKKPIPMTRKARKSCWRRRATPMASRPIFSTVRATIRATRNWPSNLLNGPSSFLPPAQLEGGIFFTGNGRLFSLLTPEVNALFLNPILYSQSFNSLKFSFIVCN